MWSIIQCLTDLVPNDVIVNTDFNELFILVSMLGEPGGFDDCLFK